MAGRKKIVAGNWKMNLSIQEGEAMVLNLLALLRSEKSDVEIILSPSFIHLPGILKLLSGTTIKLASQNCSSETSGAFTGEVSASMLQSLGVTHVIVGHSERRTIFKESNELLLKKAKQALQNKLIPIFCIGETLNERESRNQFDVVLKQLQEAVFKLEDLNSDKFILAYEPVWAIGTGKTATPEQAQEMHQYIRYCIEKDKGSTLAKNIRILYGGSCNAQNAATLFSLSDVDGGLIGGASLKAKDLTDIIKAAN